MATIAGAAEKVQDILGALTGIVAAPHEPPEGIFQTPFLVSYPKSGRSTPQGGAWAINESTIIAALYVARVYLPSDYAVAVPYIDTILNALNKDTTLQGAVTTFTDPVTWDLHTEVWAEAKYLVIQFSIPIKQSPAIT